MSRKNWQPNEHTWICSAHFVGGLKSNDPLSPAYIPSMFVHVESPVKRKAEQDMVRYERNKATRKRRLDEYLMEDTETEPEIEAPAVSTMTVLSMESIEKLEEENQLLREGNQWLEEENASLKDNITKQQLQECSFRDKETKMKFYTGLPSYAVLMMIFDFVAPYIPSTRSVLPKFQQFSWCL